MTTPTRWNRKSGYLTAAALLAAMTSTTLGRELAAAATSSLSVAAASRSRSGALGTSIGSGIPLSANRVVRERGKGGAGIVNQGLLVQAERSDNTLLLLVVLAFLFRDRSPSYPSSHMRDHSAHPNSRGVGVSSRRFLISRGRRR